MVRAARTILLGQSIFYASLGICVLLKPSGLGVNAGISYYGIFRETFVPYAIGLLGAAYFTVRAVNEIPAEEQILRFALRVYPLLVVGIVITPYAVGRWINDLHVACGSILFSLQLLLSLQLIRQQRYIWWSMLLTAAQLAGGIASAMYLAPARGLLLQAQVVFQIAFGALLILHLQIIPEHAKTAAANAHSATQ
jgi:hypothetical protein